MNKPKTENKTTYDSKFNIRILCCAWHGLVLKDISPIPLRYQSPLVLLEFQQIELTSKMAIQGHSGDLMFHTEAKYHTHYPAANLH